MKSELMFPVALGGAAIIFAADQPKKDPDTAAQLELAQLKSRVSTLEARLTALESRVPSNDLRHFVFEPGAPVAKHDPAAPPHIAERDVNGLKFYVVPLAGAAK